MATDKTVLARLAGKWSGEEFRGRWANLVGGWCVKHFERYGEPPKRALEGICEAWVSKHDDRTTTSMLEDFLASLSREADRVGEVNSEFIIDLAGKHFNRVKLDRLAEAIEGDLDAGELDDAIDRVGSFNRVELGFGHGIDVLHDDAVIEAALNLDTMEPLIRYGGALGQFFGDELVRDSFVAAMGPEKRGKSFWLLDFAWQAMIQRKRVAFFECGDSSRDQIMRRILARASRRPIKGEDKRWPIRMERDEDEESGWIVEHDLKVFDAPLTAKTAKQAVRRIQKRRLRSTRSFFKLSTHPNSTLSVDDMRGVLAEWDRQQWTPDVIVVDYADILRQPSGMDHREGINHTWKQLRALSQERHALLITATQADAKSYNRETIGRDNFSDDKRKYAHVTALFGINQTSQEKDVGVYRLNWLMRRADDYNERRCVATASCLAVASPAVISSW